ncbi:MAG: hypothetical protein ACRC1H_06940 [Caldilineaceae bacterium]
MSRKPRTAILAVSLALMAATLVAGCGPIQAQQIDAVTPLPPAGADSSAAGAAGNDATTTPTPAPLVAAENPADEAGAPTPTPLSVQMPSGEAAAALAAADAAWQPTPRARITFDEFPVPIAFDEFYEGYNMRTGLVLSDKLVSLDGQVVQMQGYMAPPLKPELDFFVLTRVRLAYCPFCSTAADWPDDIALVYLMDGTMRTTESPLRLTGRLEVGPAVDPETGMVSLVRVYATDVAKMDSLGLAP